MPAWFGFTRGIWSGRECSWDIEALGNFLNGGVSTIPAKIGDVFVGVVQTGGLARLHNDIIFLN